MKKKIPRIRLGFCWLFFARSVHWMIGRKWKKKESCWWKERSEKFRLRKTLALKDSCFVQSCNSTSWWRAIIQLKTVLDLVTHFYQFSKFWLFFRNNDRSSGENSYERRHIESPVKAMPWSVEVEEIERPRVCWAKRFPKWWNSLPAGSSSSSAHL